MGWMNCMSCGCRVHTSKLPINICDDCEVMVNEVQDQCISIPKTKDDIKWDYFKCSTCETETGYLEGTAAHCAKCSLADAQVVKEYTTTTQAEKYCLCDALNTDDPETLETISKECAALGCNVCLAKQDEDDHINWPKHYNTGKIQPIDAIEDWKLDFRLANAVKYIARAGKKDPNKTKQDLEKALWYVKRYIDKEC